MKTKIILTALFFSTISVFALPFNKNLSDKDLQTLNSGKVLIKNIDYAKNMCLDGQSNTVAADIISNVKKYNPKYLAEIIQIKEYKGNEDFPQKLEKILNNIPDYAGIPYWSERHERYYDLYKTAEIVSKTKQNNITTIDAKLYMEPFGDVCERITVENNGEYLLYTAYNTNDLKYSGISCVGPKKMKIYIYLFKENDKWIFYGVGGVNAPHLPFMTDRIRTSFINRIKTFCNFVFTKI